MVHNLCTDQWRIYPEYTLCTDYWAILSLIPSVTPGGGRNVHIILDWFKDKLTDEEFAIIVGYYMLSKDDWPL